MLRGRAIFVGSELFISYLLLNFSDLTALYLAKEHFPAFDKFHKAEKKVAKLTLDSSRIINKHNSKTTDQLNCHHIVGTN